MNKKILISLLGCAVAAIGLSPIGVDMLDARAAEPTVIDSTTFPDDTFREYVEVSIDKDGDGYLSDDEKEAVENIWLYFPDDRMETLEGIEYFTNLRSLTCAGNYLSSLDLSHNTKLTELNCHTNRLSSLDLSNNTNLEKLLCDANDLTTLDVSGFAALKELSCSCNDLTALDVSGCTALETLLCYENKLSYLDLSENTSLVKLTCSFNNMSHLDLSENTLIESFYGGENEFSNGSDSFDTADLSGFDLSKVSYLVNAAISDTVVTVIDPTSEVSYKYDCGNGFSMEVKFIPASVGTNQGQTSDDDQSDTTQSSDSDNDEAIAAFAATKPAISLEIAGANQISVSWETISGAGSYEIYMSTKKDSGYQLLTSLDASKTSYTASKLKKNKTYYFKIRAVAAINGKTVYLQESDVVAKKALGQPAKPSLKGSVRGNTLTLKWKKQSGIKKVVIYRKAGKSAWKTLKKLKGSSTSYRISLKGYEKNVKYSFYIKTYYQSGKVKIWSKPSKKVNVRL